MLNQLHVPFFLYRHLCLVYSLKAFGRFVCLLFSYQYPLKPRRPSLFFRKCG